MRIKINANQVKFQTAKAFLIKIPGNDWGFWLTSKCVFPDDGNFVIYLNESYSYLTAKLHSASHQKGKTMGNSLIDAFANTKVLEADHRPKYIDHVPDKKAPLKKRVIDDDLIRNPKQSH